MEGQKICLRRCQQNLGGGGGANGEKEWEYKGNRKEQEKIKE